MTSFTPTYNANKVNLGLCAVYLGAWDPLDPLELPADTVAVGGAWPAGWNPIGATREGVSWRFVRSTNKLYIEEQETPVINQTDTVECQVNAELAEDTLETMKLVFGGGLLTVTAPGVGQPGKTRLTIAKNLENLTLGLEQLNTFARPRRILIPKVNSVADVEQTNRRAASLRTYRATFEAMCPVDDIIIDEITADATS